MAGLRDEAGRPPVGAAEGASTRPAGPDEGNGHGGEEAPVPDPSTAPIDAASVRVRLAAASRIGVEPALRVSPPPRPLRMSNPSVGTGILGGAALAGPATGTGTAPPAGAGTTTEPDARADEPPTVRAQRQVVIDGVLTDLALRPGGHGRYVLETEGRSTRVVLESPVAPGTGARVREVLVDGFRFEVEWEPERIAALRERASRGRAAAGHGGPLEVRAIIPGKVVSVSVVPGDAVTAGQQLLVVEAMKMQNELRAPRDGTIERVGIATGVNIEVGDLLVVIS